MGDRVCPSQLQRRAASAGTDVVLVARDDVEDQPALFVGVKKLRGYLELNDESGDRMVEAGVLDTHKGYVTTSPYQVSVGPAGNPSVLMGGTKK